MFFGLHVKYAREQENLFTETATQLAVTYMSQTDLLMGLT